MMPIPIVRIICWAAVLLVVSAFAAVDTEPRASSVHPLAAASRSLPWVLILHTRMIRGRVTTVAVPDCSKIEGPCVYYTEAQCHDAAEAYETQVRMPQSGSDVVLSALAVCIPAPRRSP